MSHTPGPWRRIARSIAATHEGFIDIKVAEVTGWFGEDAATANAHLIAAAPDLLEACRAVMADFYRAADESTGPPLYAETTDTVLAAIAKAEGGAR